MHYAASFKQTVATERLQKQKYTTRPLRQLEFFARYKEHRRHRRVGSLFQGRFKAVLVENESYCWTLSRYIHLNPVRKPWGQVLIYNLSVL